MDAAAISSCLLAPPPPALLPTNFAAIARALHFSASSSGDSVLLAAGGRQKQLAVGRAGNKRRSRRASKRAPTTYITTDPANFRIMVQHITGVHDDPAADHMLLLHQPTATLDAAVLLAADNDDGNPIPLMVGPGPGGDEAAALRHLDQQQPCFPTLDSWNVMYERNDLLI